ncbi:MAG: hypothetical protein DHS20C14_18380 [Phycisphaeraceae bacterium]|nr:MAG: hypothetical protein DHS20C14_18380 [Phycisphaeraceae bacterium]
MDDSTQAGAQPDDHPEPRSPGAAPAPSQARGARVEIADPDSRLAPPALVWLREHAAMAARELAARTGAAGEARIRVVGDDEMRRVHAERSGIDTTTDVLTFDLAPDDDALLDADVYVCIDEATREGTERGIAPERELLLYTLHAMLHCVGHDDHDDDAFARMHALEDEILGAIGVGATFGVSPRGEGAR